MLRAEDIYKCVKPNLWKHVTKAVAARAGAAGHSPEASELRLRAGEAAGECGGRARAGEHAEGWPLRQHSEGLCRAAGQAYGLRTSGQPHGFHAAAIGLHAAAVVSLAIGQALTCSTMHDASTNYCLVSLVHSRVRAPSLPELSSVVKDDLKGPIIHRPILLGACLSLPTWLPIMIPPYTSWQEERIH